MQTPISHALSQLYDKIKLFNMLEKIYLLVIKYEVIKKHIIFS